MKAREFLRMIDDARVIAAVQQAEARTSGEVRVFVSRRPLQECRVKQRAHEEFRRMGMASTDCRNAVLFFLVPGDRAFAVVGDEAVHAKCGQAFWDETAKAMESAFKQGDFTAGLVAGIGRAGDLLAVHFPRLDDDRNELTDKIARD